MAQRARALAAMLLSGCFLDSIGTGGSGGDPDASSSAGAPSVGGQATGGEPAVGAGASGGGGASTGGSSGDGGSGGAAPPCSEITIWPSSAQPSYADFMDPEPVELGVKFRADVAGTVRGVRFYKGTVDPGAHVGHLWSATGQLLATTAFSAESPSGWQQADFDPPVSVAANTTYIASYHSPSGYYAADDGYFLGTAVDNPPLHALQNGVDGENAVFIHGPSATFPDESYNGSNYWVDVVLCF